MLKISPGAQENNLCFLEITKINDTLPFWASINPHHWFVGFAQSCVCRLDDSVSALERIPTTRCFLQDTVFFFLQDKISTSRRLRLLFFKHKKRFKKRSGDISERRLVTDTTDSISSRHPGVFGALHLTLHLFEFIDFSQ